MPGPRRFLPEAVRAAAEAQRELLADAGAALVTTGAATDPLPGLIQLVALSVHHELEVDPGAMRIAVRALADQLASAHPGRSVEVRIPPYAAVQCIPGPRHTRGTPPNVVETDPATFVSLACGFTPWEDAVRGGRVLASGERADLSPFLPLDIPLGPSAGP